MAVWQYGRWQHGARHVACVRMWLRLTVVFLEPLGQHRLTIELADGFGRHSWTMKSAEGRGSTAGGREGLR